MWNLNYWKSREKKKPRYPNINTCSSALHTKPIFNFCMTEEERGGKDDSPATHLNCGFDLIPIFIFFCTRELHLSQYQWAACRFSHFAACIAQADESRGGSCFAHLYGWIKGRRGTRRGSKASQTERERNENKCIQCQDC